MNLGPVKILAIALSLLSASSWGIGPKKSPAIAPVLMGAPGWRDAIEIIPFETSSNNHYVAIKVIPIKDKETRMGLDLAHTYNPYYPEFENAVRAPTPQKYDDKIGAVLREFAGRFAFKRYRAEDEAEMPEGFFDILQQKSGELKNPSGLVVIFRHNDFTEPVATLQFTHTSAEAPELPLTSIFDVKLPESGPRIDSFALREDHTLLEEGKPGNVSVLTGGYVELNKVVVSEKVKDDDLLARAFLYASTQGTSLVDRPDFIKMEDARIKELTREAQIRFGHRHAVPPPDFTPTEIRDGDYRIFPDKIYAVCNRKRLKTYRKLGFKLAEGVDLGPLRARSDQLRLLELSRRDLLIKSVKALLLRSSKASPKDEPKPRSKFLRKWKGRDQRRENTYYRPEILKNLRNNLNNYK